MRNRSNARSATIKIPPAAENPVLPAELPNNINAINKKTKNTITPIKRRGDFFFSYILFCGGGGAFSMSLTACAVRRRCSLRGGTYLAPNTRRSCAGILANAASACFFTDGKTERSVSSRVAARTIPQCACQLSPSERNFSNSLRAALQIPASKSCSACFKPPFSASFTGAVSSAFSCGAALSSCTPCSSSFGGSWAIGCAFAACPSAPRAREMSIKDIHVGQISERTPSLVSNSLPHL